ncbi:hypothetical protein BH10PSE17_BH10PSE17_34070 [soil metagenome]
MAAQTEPESFPGSDEHPPLYDGANYVYGVGIGYWLKRSALIMTKTIEQEMAAHGLTDAQWLPLFALRKTSARTAADLAKVFDYDAGAMTRLIDRVEAKGLIQRVRSTDDRRVVNLELTAEGMRAADTVPFVLSEVLNRQLRGISRAEHDQMIGLLQRMVANGDPRYADLAACAPEIDKDLS